MTNSILGDETAPSAESGPTWPTMAPRTPSGSPYSYSQPPATLAELQALQLPELLARVPRWGGQGSSVLRHTVLTMRLAVELADRAGQPHQELRRYAAAHDLHEGVVLDIPRPLKALLPDYQALEARWEAAVHRALGLDWPRPPGVATLLERAHAEATVLEMWLIDHPDTDRMNALMGWTDELMPKVQVAHALQVLEAHTIGRLCAEVAQALGLEISDTYCRVCCCTEAEACQDGCEWVDEDPPHPDGPICSACVE